MPLFSNKPQILNKAQQAAIHEDCLMKNSDAAQGEYTDQQNGLGKVFESVDKNTPVTVDLIKQLHQLFTASNLECKPGQFRDRILGTVVHDSRDTLTREGIKEIITIIQEEEQEKFPEYHGTWLGPYDPYTGTASLHESIYHNRLAEALQGSTLEKLTENLYQDSLERKYMILFPRTQRENLAIKDHVEDSLKRLVSEFNKEISAKNSNDEKIGLIVSFIKRCLRLHPFNDGNHRVFILGMLNFLLLQQGIGHCKLENRRQFIFCGVDESVKKVKDNLVLLNATQESTKVDQIIAEDTASKVKMPLSKLAIDGRAFSTIIQKYNSTSWLSRQCFFNPNRSRAIKELQKLSTNSLITHEQVEEALRKDSSRRLKLFKAEVKENSTSTDKVIVELSKIFTPHSF